MTPTRTWAAINHREGKLNVKSEHIDDQIAEVMDAYGITDKNFKPCRTQVDGLYGKDKLPTFGVQHVEPLYER